jgi:hypothetical protein
VGNAAYLSGGRGQQRVVLELETVDRARLGTHPHSPWDAAAAASRRGGRIGSGGCGTRGAEPSSHGGAWRLGRDTALSVVWSWSLHVAVGVPTLHAPRLHRRGLGPGSSTWLYRDKRVQRLLSGMADTTQWSALYHAYRRRHPQGDGDLTAIGTASPRYGSASPHMAAASPRSSSIKVCGTWRELLDDQPPLQAHASLTSLPSTVSTPYCTEGRASPKPRAFSARMQVR